MKRVSGFFTLLGSCFAFGTILYLFFEESESNMNLGQLALVLLLLFSSFCGIYYTMATRFWILKDEEIKVIEKENEIIKRKIDRQELLSKLKDLEKNT